MREVYRHEETPQLHPGVSFPLVDALVRSDDTALVSGRGIKVCIDRAGPYPARPKRACGTGTLTLLIKYTHPNVSVYGLDVDPRVLGIARRKAEQAGEAVVLQQGSATCLPYPGGTFERVFASLMLHHLTQEDKRLAIGEAFCVLKPGGELHVADFCKPHDLSMWLISLVVRWVEEVHDNILGLLPVFMAEAGFCPVEETVCYRTVSANLALYRACKPTGEVL
ncbi:MAG: class I SAM-dependent methyltransferase [Methylobacter sp.]|nr:class I SAM-dependent methyltransferase [Methylobacter sp.]